MEGCQPDDARIWNDGPGLESGASVAINPRNPKNLVVAYTSDTFYGAIVASSFDGGRTWRRTVVRGLTYCTGGPRDQQHVGISPPVFGPDGLVYVGFTATWGLFPEPRTFVSRIFAVSSRNGGRTWSRPVQVDDMGIGSRGGGIVAEPDVAKAAVSAWVAPVPVASSYLSRTTDGGRTWSTTKLPVPSPQFAVYLTPVAARDGRLYVLYTNEPGPKAVTQTVGHAGLPTSVFITTSDDKGKTWSMPRAILDGIIPDEIGAVEGADRSLVVTAWQGTDTAKRLVMMRSTDRGTTWSRPRLVADDLLPQMPHLVVARRELAVTYVRPQGNNGELVLARSSDDGRTWTRRVLSGPYALPPSTVGAPRAAWGVDGLAAVFIRAGTGTYGTADVYLARVP
jgi:photosystem II stability/assembly factor-like uncharacterized protein